MAKIVQKNMRTVPGRPPHNVRPQPTIQELNRIIGKSSSVSVVKRANEKVANSVVRVIKRKTTPIDKRHYIHRGNGVDKRPSIDKRPFVSTVKPITNSTINMKTLVFCTGWSDNENWNIYQKWIEEINVKCDQILIPDDGSKILPCFKDFQIITGNLPDSQPSSRVIMYHWDNCLGRPSSLNYPGWYRSFMFVAEYAQRYGFKKIIHIEADCRLISKKIQLYVNELINGWVAFYCPKHNFPETGIQIIAGDSILEFVKFSKIPYNKFVNFLAEKYFPFTVNRKDFIGDRYSEYPKEIPLNADYACQIVT